MNRTYFGLAIVVCVVLVLSAKVPVYGDDGIAPDVMQSRLACRELGESLKGKMQDAVQRHSFTGALAVCREAAPAIAAEISEKHGIVIRRTSMKVRNPANRADAWERNGLTELEARITAGADPSLAEVFESVTNDDGTKEFRYLKAIMAEPLCLSCHGEALDDAMKRELSEHYPDDQAVGYKAGDMRGAFSVTIP